MVYNEPLDKAFEKFLKEINARNDPDYAQKTMDAFKYYADMYGCDLAEFTKNENKKNGNEIVDQ